MISLEAVIAWTWCYVFQPVGHHLQPLLFGASEGSQSKSSESHQACYWASYSISWICL